MSYSTFGSKRYTYISKAEERVVKLQSLIYGSGEHSSLTGATYTQRNGSKAYSAMNAREWLESRGINIHEVVEEIWGKTHPHLLVEVRKKETENKAITI